MKRNIKNTHTQHHTKKKKIKLSKRHGVTDFIHCVCEMKMKKMKKHNAASNETRKTLNLLLKQEK